MALKGSKGIVVEELGDQVRVCIIRRRGCRGCAVHKECPLPKGDGFFNLFFGGKPLEVLAQNAAGARVGDECLVELRSGINFLKASLAVYLIPGLLFLTGLALGGLLGERFFGLSGDLKVLGQLLGGLVLLLIGFAGATLYGRLRRREFTPVVTAVLKRADPDRSEPLSD